MPGHIMDYRCFGCGMKGSVSPGGSLFGDSYVIAYDPEKDRLETLEYKQAIQKNLQIFQDPYIAGDNWKHSVWERDAEGRDAGERSPDDCPSCGGRLVFRVMGFWD